MEVGSSAGEKKRGHTFFLASQRSCVEVAQEVGDPFLRWAFIPSLPARDAQGPASSTGMNFTMVTSHRVPLLCFFRCLNQGVTWCSDERSYDLSIQETWGCESFTLASCQHARSKYPPLTTLGLPRAGCPVGPCPVRDSPCCRGFTLPASAVLGSDTPWVCTCPSPAHPRPGVDTA